jgi:hypothetical protein
MALGMCVPCVVHAQGALPKIETTAEVRQQLRALLPSVRIDDGDMKRALDPVPWTVCRSISVEWQASNARESGDVNDGSLKFIAESRCREPYDVRASARIGSGGLVTIATDREGGLLWWKQMPDIRRVRPALFPSTGDERVDRENRRLHAQGVRVGFSRFSIDIPGDRRIARVLIYEATRKESARSPILLGSIAVPVP